MLTFKNKFDKASAIFESTVMTQDVLILQENKNIYNTSEASVYKICRENFEVVKEYFEKITFPQLINENAGGSKIDTIKTIIKSYLQALKVMFQKMVVNIKAKIMQLFTTQMNLKKYMETHIKDIESGWVKAHSNKVKYKTVIEKLEKIKLEDLSASGSGIFSAFNFDMSNYLNAVTGGVVTDSEDLVQDFINPKYYNAINAITLSEAKSTLETIIFKKGKMDDNFTNSIKKTVEGMYTRQFEDFSSFEHAAIQDADKVTVDKSAAEIHNRFVQFSAMLKFSDIVFQNINQEEVPTIKLALDKMTKLITLFTNALFIVHSNITMYRSARLSAMQSIAKDLCKIGTAD